MDPDQAIADIISECSDGAPDISFTTRENVIQNIWIIKDPAIINVISKKFENKQLFIADGHHRYETALITETPVMKLTELKSAHSRMTIL